MKIAIAGYGVEGRANYEYWSQDPQNELTILDEKASPNLSDYPEDAQVIVGPQAFDDLKDYDMVVRTAGLPPRKLKSSKKFGRPPMNFFAKCPAKVIGVTGSKGKGTTASFIASILRAAGKTVWLVGNIGVPSLEVLAKIEADDIVVYELSSFQLWDAQYSPHVSVILFIEPEHLDVHTDMEEYVQAKARIVHHQQAHDTVVFNANNEHTKKIVEQSIAQRIPYPDAAAAYIQDDWFWYGSHKLCPVSTIQLRGEHNRENALAAIDACWPFVQDPQVITQGLAAFAGLPHRLEYIRTVGDVEYFDDSIATTPTSAIAALRSFGDHPKVIILGGSYKGSDFSKLAQELTQHSAHALVIGEEASRLMDAFQKAGFTHYEHLEDDGIDSDYFMELVVRRAHELAQPGGVVLLSPAAASFGLFKNYADRGQHFVAAVNELE